MIAYVTSDWSDEILISAANLDAYRLIYEAETWLRRIALTSLVLAEGQAWARKIDSSLRVVLKLNHESTARAGFLESMPRKNCCGPRRLASLRISCTPRQLQTVLRLSLARREMFWLRGFSSIADVRNALAHNRAISDDTLAVLNGDLVVVRAAARRFKARTLYAKSEILLGSAAADLASLATAFDSMAERLPHQQLFLAANDDFIFCVSLPVKPFDRWPQSGSASRDLGPNGTHTPVRAGEQDGQRVPVRIHSLLLTLSVYRCSIASEPQLPLTICGQRCRRSTSIRQTRPGRDSGAAKTIPTARDTVGEARPM